MAEEEEEEEEEKVKEKKTQLTISTKKKRKEKKHPKERTRPSLSLCYKVSFPKGLFLCSDHGLKGTNARAENKGKGSGA